MDNILVIDDDKIITILLNNLLNDCYNVFVLNEVDISITDYILENNISLVLLDIVMPKKNGFEIAKEIKGNEKTDKIPIIFLTANTDESFILSAFDNDADDYIKKPFNKKELKARIKTHISNYNYLKQIQDQQQLIYTQAMNIGMNDMLVKISHHWRQPLSVISLSAQSLNIENEFGTLDKDSVRALTKDIINTVSELSENINFFSEMYSNKTDVKSFNPNEDFEYLLLTIKELFYEKFIKINFSNNLDGAESFFVDINALKTVLVNVATNSVDAYEKYLPDDKKIDVEISNDDKNFIIDFIDYAGGIADENISKVFNAYFSTKDSLNGTGLGLFITQNVVVKNLKGKIKLTNISKDNKKGLKVIITIPFSQD